MGLTYQDLKAALLAMHDIVQSLDKYFTPPEIVRINEGIQYRHAEQTDLLLSQLKCVRAVSTLNACLFLLHAGYVQEVGALCRCVDEFCQDVMFLAGPLGEDGKLSEQQWRLVKEFYQEEIAEGETPLSAKQDRNRVPRAKVLAGIARLQGQPVNQHDAKELQETLVSAYSGYVHGAYVHTMEMYGGKVGSGQFHMQGLLGTPRIVEWTESLGSYVGRTNCAIAMVAKRCGALDLVNRANEIEEALMKASGEKDMSPSEIRELVAKMRRGI